jgi:hypothetical protein
MLTGLLVTLYLFDPSESSFFPPCPFRALTGLLCPGCGTTRAIHQLLHGNLVAAVTLSPLLVLISPTLGYALVSTLVLAARDRPLPVPMIHSLWIWVLLMSIVLLWIIRNL